MRRRKIYFTNKDLAKITGVNETTLRRWDYLYKLSTKDDEKVSRYDRKTAAKIIKFARLDITRLKELWLKGKIKIETIH